MGARLTPNKQLWAVLIATFVYASFAQDPYALGIGIGWLLGFLHAKCSGGSE